ncbi:MAG: hypothetical protein AB7J63_01695 [Vicinamibacterales bacterium]
MTLSDFGGAAALLTGLSLAAVAGLIAERRFGATARESRGELVFQAVIALLMTTFYFSWHPHSLVDDAGFIVRYLLQSDAGCWYCFNAADGPMFGISSFSHGAINLLLYQVGFGSPERCLLATNAAGTFLAAWLLLRILRHLRLRPQLAVPLAFIALFGAKSWMRIGATGMEVPIHTAVVLAALLALARRQGPALWFWLSMAVISKLDAVPIAVAFGALHLWSAAAAPRERRTAWSQVVRHSLVEAALFAGIPLTLWIAFSTWYFGSPLPHTATAKLLLHRSTLDHWFPFLERYLTGAWLRVVFALFLVIWPTHVALEWRRARSLDPDTAAGWAFVGLLVLYFVYNPDERMEWYYALPDLFLVLQVLLSLQFVGDALPGAIWKRGVALSLVAFGSLCLFDAAWGVRGFTTYLRSLESERSAIGKYVATHTVAGDVLLAGHGLPSAWTSALVVDHSGLNSDRTLQYRGDWGKMVRTLRPDAIVVGGYEYYLGTLQGLPYRIDATFYEIADEGAPPWQFMRKVDISDAFFITYMNAADWSGIDALLPNPEVFAGEGTVLTWTARTRDAAPRFLRMGVRRPPNAPAVLLVETSWDGDVIEERRFDIPAAEERPERSLHWHGIVVPLDERLSGRAGYRVTLRLTDGSPVRLYAPALTRN